LRELRTPEECVAAEKLLADRLVVAWNLVDLTPRSGGGEPGPRILDHNADGDPVVTARLAARAALRCGWAAGYRPAGITGDGCYVLVRA
jgi:hypothetical protein